MAQTRNRYAYDRSYYEQLSRRSAFDGNAARELETEEELYADEFAEVLAAPEEEYEYQEELVTEPVVQTPRELKTRFRSDVNWVRVAVMSVMFGVLLACALQLVFVSSEITRTEKQIRTANTKLADVEALNESLSASLDMKPDRNYIYSVAVGKLGMVYPDGNTVLFYDASDDGYVRQYAVIR